MKKFMAVIGTALAAVLLTLGLFGCTQVSKVKVIEIGLTEEPYAFAVNKNDTATMAAANELITSLMEDGTIAALVEKYSGADKTDFFTYENPTEDPNLNTQLVVSTNAEFAPFEFKSGNKFTGVDIEIADLLAKKLGKTLYVLDGKFDNVIPNVNAGNAHIGMAGLTVTEERKVSVNFTNHYYISSQVVIANASDTKFDNCKTKEDVYAVLNALPSAAKIGFQNATTGEFFTTSDYNQDGSCVIKAQGKGYENGALAVKDLQYGRIDYVIIDLKPALSIAAQLNASAEE